MAPLGTDGIFGVNEGHIYEASKRKCDGFKEPFTLHKPETLNPKS